MSKYEKVYEKLKKMINDGVLKPGEELESESALCKKFNYSKDTVRKALQMLEFDGYIQKIKGKNSKVLAHHYSKISLSKIRTKKELNKSQKLDIKTKLISLYIIQGDKHIMNIFSSTEKDDYYKVVRTRTIEGETIEYDELYFDRNIIKYMSEDVPKTSIYEYIENELKLKISHAIREIKFRYATEEEKKYMDLNGYDMVVELEGLTYLSNGILFQYGKTIYRPDKFTFLTTAKR